MKKFSMVTLYLFGVFACHIFYAMDTNQQEAREPGGFRKILTKIGDKYLYSISTRVLNEIRNNEFPLHRDNRHRLNRAIDEFRKNANYEKLKELLELCKNKNIKVDSLKALQDAHAYFVAEENSQKKTREKLANQAKKIQRETNSTIAKKLSICIAASTSKFTTRLDRTKEAVEKDTETAIEASKTALENMAAIITSLQKGQELTTQVGEFNLDGEGNQNKKHEVVYPNANNTGTKTLVETLEQINKKTKTYVKEVKNLLERHISDQKETVDKK